MTDREKLVELIDQKQIWGIDQIQPRKYDILLLENEDLADHLIANGVTVQEWIPVTERLPIEEVKKYRGETGEDPEFNVMIKGGLVPTSLFFNGEYWYCNFDDSYAVTHWMPLPPPPKGE